MDLGLSAEDAWDLTPRLAAEMLERKNEIRREEWRTQRVLFGEVAAATYNVHRDPQRRPSAYTWEDIFPEAQKQQEPQTAEQMMLSMHMWTALAKARARLQGEN